MSTYRAALPLFAPRYPDVPGAKTDGPSLAAANRMRRHDKKLRELALEMLRAEGPLTADEVAARLGRTVLSIRPRISQLNKKGLVIDTGERRLNESGSPATVWRAA